MSGLLGARSGDERELAAGGGKKYLGRDILMSGLLGEAEG